MRWLLIIEILIQPFVCFWLIVIAMRIRRDQEHIRQFVKIWGDRLHTTTTLPDTTQLDAIQQSIVDHDRWERDNAQAPKVGP